MRQQRRNLITAGAISPDQLAHRELSLAGNVVPGSPEDQIATWADSSGHARDATQATLGKRPYISGGSAFNPNSPTGQRGIGFNRLAPSFMGGSSGDVGVTAGQTFFAWLWCNTVGVNGQVLYQDQGGGSPQLRVSDDSNGRIGWRDAATTHISTSNITADGLFHSLVYVFSPPSGGTGIATVYLDGTNVFQDTWSFTTAATTSYLLGANQVENLPISVTLYELDFYSQGFTPDIISRVLQWGHGFYGF